MKLSDLTETDLRELRVLAAIELAYPEQTKALGDKRASVILGKWEALDASREKPTTGGVRQCATCGAKSTMANSVGWTFDQDTLQRWCPSCAPHREAA